MRPNGRLRCFAVAFVAVAVVACAAPAWAYSGMAHRTTDPVAGLRLDVDTRWVGSSGYRPVRFVVTPLTAKPDDRVLDISFVARRDRVRTYDLEARQQIVVPAGSTRPVEATLPVQQHAAWSTYSVVVRVGGRDAPRLSLPDTRCRSSDVGWAECFPAILIVDDELPDTSRLASHFPLEAYFQYGRDYGGSSGQQRDQMPTAVAQGTNDLPERWIDYSSVDVVCIGLKKLRALAAQRPAVFEALTAWTAAGGNLWVTGVNRSQRNELDALLNQPAAGGEPQDAGSVAWRSPERRNYGRSIRGALSGQSGVIGDDYIDNFELGRSGNAAGRPVRNQGDRTPPFVLRNYALGTVTAIASDDAFADLTGPDWGWVLSETGADRWLWYKRHGVSLSQNNDEFLEFLIPDVGLAPVTAFCVLITLFALAIGPVNYYFLKRWRRIHLLVLTIPLGAATVTVLLFAYAILSDGLGTRVRARTATHIDQRRGHAVCWSRLSYYAGLTPSGGLAFPADVAVYPIQHFPPGTGRNWGRQIGLRQEMFWGDEQLLKSGYLAPRTPTQFLTVRTRATRRGLQIRNEQGRLAVINQLGTPIHQLLICGKDGNTYWAENVAADGNATAAPIALRKARERLESACQENEPEAIDGSGQYGSGSMFGMSRRRYWMWSGSNSALDPPTFSTSRLEQALVSARNRYPSNSDPLATPRTYLAIVQRSPEVTFGTPGARQEESFHVVFGSW